MNLNKLLAIIAAIITLSACNSTERQGSASAPNMETTEDGVTIEYDETFASESSTKEIETSCEANDLAQFIAGIDNEKYSLLQISDSYQTYVKNTRKTWNEFNARTLSPIKEWCEANIPQFHNDTTCLFYPFGGPDLIFAMTFFPYEKDYILCGLENPGQLCDPNHLSELQVNQYLDSLQFSLRYIYRYGFFVAKQMITDFRNKDLDGTIHLALYTLALENCKIRKYRQIYIDDRGEIQEGSGLNLYHPYGWEITFQKDGDPRQRTVKYLKFNAEDQAINGHMEFPFYLNSIKEKTCYLKSASYLMQSVEFKTMQKLILNQCDRILQDESGFAYAKIKKGYGVRLFGSYTGPVRDFKIFPQNDLKDALVNNNCKPLPFKIGYAAQHNEGVLMACVKGEPNIENNAKPASRTLDGVAQVSSSAETEYKIQFLVSWHQLESDSPEFNGLTNVQYYKDGTHYKYTVGSFSSDRQCMQLLQEVKDKGFQDAFIVKFQNGKRIK